MLNYNIGGNKYFKYFQIPFTSKGNCIMSLRYDKKTYEVKYELRFQTGYYDGDTKQ